MLVVPKLQLLLIIKQSYPPNSKSLWEIKHFDIGIFNMFHANLYK